MTNRVFLEVPLNKNWQTSHKIINNNLILHKTYFIAVLKILLYTIL